MHDRVRRLGWLWIGYSALVDLVASVAVVALLSAGHRQAAGELLAVAVAALPGYAAGWGLLHGRSWARKLALILAVVNAFAFPPVGTALAVLTFRWLRLTALQERG